MRNYKYSAMNVRRAPSTVGCGAACPNLAPDNERQTRANLLTRELGRNVIIPHADQLLGHEMRCRFSTTLE